MSTIKCKNIAVVGGAGFIGSNFARYLYHRYPHYNIYNIDLLTYAGNTENFNDIKVDDVIECYYMEEIKPEFE